MRLRLAPARTPFGGRPLGSGIRAVCLAGFLPRLAGRGSLLAGPLGLPFGLFHPLAGALELIFGDSDPLPGDFGLQAGSLQGLRWLSRR